MENNDVKKYMAKTRIAPYTALNMPDAKVNVDKIADDIEKLNYLTVTKDLIDKAKEVYKNDKSKGMLLKKFFLEAEKVDLDLASTLLEIVKHEEPAIFLKEDIFQQLVFTGMLMKMFLIILADNENDKELASGIVDLIGLIRYDYKPEVWLSIAIDKLIPGLREYKNYIKRYLKDYYKNEGDKDG